ncbi:hypothetical protein D3C79_970260 [compost metagenome]
MPDLFLIPFKAKSVILSTFLLTSIQDAGMILVPAPPDSMFSPLTYSDSVVMVNFEKLCFTSAKPNNLLMVVSLTFLFNVLLISIDIRLQSAGVTVLIPVLIRINPLSSFKIDVSSIHFISER